MANSTFFDCVNRILLEAGQSAVADTTTFNSNNSLTKTQLQTKYFVDRANRGLIRKLRARWLKRELSLNLSAYPGTANSYALSSTIRLENIVDGSVFISGATYGRKLEYVPYEEWKKRFPQGETVAGIPRFWYDLPRTANSENDKIAFSPPPSKTLTVTYEAYLRPVVLVNASDEIAFEPDWEDVLWTYALTWLEMSLSEGKMPAVQQFCEPMFSEIRQLTLGVSEKPPSVDFGMSIEIPSRRGRRSAYSPN